jgi:hypothetical protein
MTAVVSTYILMAPEGFEISKNISLWVGALLALFSFLFTLWYAKRIKSKEIAYA